MSNGVYNKYRAAISVLQRGRETLVEELAEEIVEQGDDLMAGTFTFNELLETQGTRLHFLGLLIGHLEQSADAFDESHTVSAKPSRPRKRKRNTEVEQQASKEGSPEDL